MRSFFKQMTHGLRQRWVGGSVLVVFIVIVLVVVTFSFIMYNYYHNTMRMGLESKAKTATDFFSDHVAGSAADYYGAAYSYTETFVDADRLELQFLDATGRVMVSSFSITSGSRPGTPEIAEALSGRQMAVWSGRRDSTGEHIMAVSAPLLYSGGQVLGVMRYITSMELVDRQVTRSILLVSLTGVLILLIVILLNLVFVRSVIRPVGEITRVSKRIAEGSYGVQIESAYRDEIGEMVQSINEMSLKIAQAEKVQAEFISSISHELRTPLTAITGWGETLIYGEHLDGETKSGIAIILKEARRLTKMVEELLEFTRMEDGRFTLNIEQTDVAAELEDSIFTYRELLHQDELELHYTPCPDELPLIPGDPSRLRQVFLNILDNAAKYGREGGRIEVSVALEGGFVAIMFRDRGPGVPEDELGHVRMKFYKGANAKGRGSGIGLAVCDEIIKYHGGVMELSNPEGGGLLVKILLPVSAAAV